MEVFLIDSWNLIKQDKQIKFLRQAEQGKLFHLRTFFRQPVRTCSTWVISADNLSPYQETYYNWSIFSDTLSEDVKPLDYFSQTVSRFFRETSSTWNVLTDKLSRPFN